MTVSATRIITSLTLFSGVCQVVRMINNFAIGCHLVTLGFLLRLLIPWHKYAQVVLWGVCACSTTVYELTTMYTNDTWHQYAQEHSPLAFWIVKTWHLSWVCSIISSPCILKPKAIISSIPMCYYAKCHNISNSSLKEVTFVGKEYHIGNQWAWHFETPRDLV